ncbi:MAG: hypothetical protein B7X07_06830, partial [Actinobacteria bacterium 21-64-8]
IGGADGVGAHGDPGDVAGDGKHADGKTKMVTKTGATSSGAFMGAFFGLLFGLLHLLLRELLLQLGLVATVVGRQATAADQARRMAGCRCVELRGHTSGLRPVASYFDLKKSGRVEPFEAG